MKSGVSFFARQCVGLVITVLISLVVGNAQQAGVITGRVVTEGGGGMSNVTVGLFPVSTGQRGGSRQITTITDEEGNFKFTGVTPASYSINVTETKGYVRQPIPASERTIRRYYRIGDHATIPLVRGGVITGRVTTAEGDPMIGEAVSAIMVRDAEGNPIRRQFGGRQRVTDDRGVYRLYGLAPGTYIVVARNNYSFPLASSNDSEAPTYYPSSTRDTAGEVSVASGGEVSGIDIRFRAERGRIVSGVLLSGGETFRPYTDAYVNLFSLATGQVAGLGYIRPGESTNGFTIYGVTDGEYEIIARRGGANEGEILISMPYRVTVKGADVTGIELKLMPQASITGKVVIDSSANACETARKFSIEESVISLRRDENASEPRTFYASYITESAPTDKGDISLRNIDPGRYYIESRLPTETWYVKSIATSISPATGVNLRRPAVASNPLRNGIALKSGEKLSGLTVTFSSGAASLSGKVVAEKEGARLPSRVRLHLAPTETARAEDVLRYAETIVWADGAFNFTNIAPGRYWLVARAVPEEETFDRPPAPVAWDANERAKLRREAEALKFEIELKPCQRATDQIVKFTK